MASDQKGTIDREGAIWQSEKAKGTCHSRYQPILHVIRDRLKIYDAKSLPSPKKMSAGVIIPLYEKEGRVFILLTKRTETVRIHKGEVSLPGGMSEARDRSTMDTALREFREEVGVVKRDVNIIGRLDDVITLTGVIITPYVGIIPYPYPFRTSQREVAYLIHLPLKYLVKCTAEYREEGRDSGIKGYPAISYQSDRIWGATYRILLQLRQIICLKADYQKTPLEKK